MSTVIAILVGAALLLGKTLLLVGVLALLTPLWCFVFACVLLFIAFLLCLVHCSGVVLSGTVDCDQFQGLILAGVVKLVFGSSWYDNDITSFDVLFYSVSCYPSLPPSNIKAGVREALTCSFPATTALPVPDVKINT